MPKQGKATRAGANERIRPQSENRASGRGWAIFAIGVTAVAAAGGAAWSTACSRKPPPGATDHQPRQGPSVPYPAISVADNGADAGASSDAAADADKPYEGPFIGAAGLTVPVYSEMDFAREKMIGYLRSGAKAPVNAKATQTGNCKAGWYKLIPRGYVCGKYVTLDLEDPRVRLGITAPKLDQTVPYQYAYNTKDGTPLYRSVPSREQMNTYEPYLVASKKPAEPKKKKHGEDGAEPDGDLPKLPAVSDDGEVKTAMDSQAGRDAGAPLAEAPDAAEPPKPWWQVAPDAGRPEVKLSDLTEGSDAILAKRMVKGFFVAVDKQFGWNNRLWYKTTEGLVAPADRMAINKPPTFHGVELGGAGQPKLPVGFVTSTNAYKYELAGEKEPERKGKAPLHTIAALTGKTAQRKGAVYKETTDGWWMRSNDGTWTEPGAPPPEVGPNDKWIDINVSRQTLVAFEGPGAVYATMISSGKTNTEDKSKDHSTVLGTYRVREKHIAATMDGDGAAPGENPYSIQDVPFIMYFRGSYALHGAFWHNNFGHKMSHGCVNLSPLDAKHVFLWSSPSLPQGWHGAWATKDDPGTVIVIHE
jgi:lipoprotein-anchoring transpeptidase ErfK/SrfK